jgi:hypothetical protein
MEKFITKCQCGNKDVQFDSSSIRPCSVCGGIATPVCAGCEESIINCDVKDCTNGYIVHALMPCWKKCIDKYS